MDARLRSWLGLGFSSQSVLPSAALLLCVGNFFFAGARLFFRSLEAAIFLFSRVARIPEGSLVLPAICTEERITLGAELANGAVIRGQNEISHPSAPGALCTHFCGSLTCAGRDWRPGSSVFPAKHHTPGVALGDGAVAPRPRQVKPPSCAWCVLACAAGSLLMRLGLQGRKVAKLCHASKRVVPGAELAMALSSVARTTTPPSCA